MTWLKPSSARRRFALPILLALYALSIGLSAGVFAPSAHAKAYEIAQYDIDLSVTTDGHYLITERITYDFLEGTFTNAERDVPGKGFGGLRFISVEGVEYPVESVNASDGRNLRVRWTYPEATGRATFVIRYEALDALQSKDGRNVIDWNPIGSGWTVPIKNINVTIDLPSDPGEIDAEPAEDLRSPATASSIRFHREQLPPRTFYHVVVSFPEIISMVRRPSPPVAPWVLLGIFAGASLAVIEIRSRLRRNARPAPSGRDPLSLSLIEMATILYSTNVERRRGIVATIFSLAQRGKIKLVVKPKSSAFGADEVLAEVLTDEGLTDVESTLVSALRRRKSLRKFASESLVFSKLLRHAIADMQAQGLISETMRRAQWRAVATGIALLLLGIVALILYAAAARVPALLGFAFLLIFHALGRLIGASVIDVCTAEGVYLKNEVRRIVAAKMKRVDDLMRYEAKEAWNELFASLPYLTLSEKFTAGKIDRLKKGFRRLDHIDPPHWIDYDTANIGKTIDALTVADSVNYSFVVIVAASASTGATGVSGASGVGGVGAAGSGAGGGGGGAG